MEALRKKMPPVLRTVGSLRSISACQLLLNDLLEMSPAYFGRHDIALLNLLCAPNLPGSEHLNIPKALTRLDQLTAFVRENTERNVSRSHLHPDYGHSEPMWRMAMLVTLVKRDFGAAYSPVARDELRAGVETPWTDSRDVFIHGLLDNDPKRRWGTCASIPVLIVAVARRLGYPVGLAASHRHLFARWEGLEYFNIEASNPMGMTVHSDEEYRNWEGKLTSKQLLSGHYVRTLHPAEEFAEFLKLRVCILRDAARYDETLLWSARSLQYAPDDPIFPHAANQILEIALKHRMRTKYPRCRIPPLASGEPFVCNLGELVAPSERSLVLTIMGHYHEAVGELNEAQEAYEEACRQNPCGNNEPRDLERFINKRPLGVDRSPNNRKER